MSMISRRAFAAATAGLLCLPAGAHAQAQAAADTPWAGHPICDCHLHPRPTAAADLAHMDGCGVSSALLLPPPDAPDLLQAARKAYPDRVLGRFARVDPGQADGAAILAREVKDGAVAIGEIKSTIALDSPELRRLYAAAADLDVPILIHFQDHGYFPGAPGYDTGFARFEQMLKAYPRTRFIGHANSFWAGIGADDDGKTMLPRGKVAPGGLTDRLLADYPNLQGDLSALSGNRALSRDPAFTAGFLKRHQDKLIFGSDCDCRDGRGGGSTQGPMAGKCIARETLGILWAATTPEVFHKLVWTNAHRAYRLGR